jgi:gliding motility-associated-like protein
MLGNFSPAKAGPGTHTIWYVFNTTGGCKDSVSSTITVYPKPAAAFAATGSICQGAAATITDQSTIASGSITSWKWTFGDGSSATYANGNSFTRQYNSSNTYNVKLVAVSDNSCVSDTVTHTIAVHPLPVAGFDLPAAICMPGGEAVFTNTSAVADNSALSWQWAFGDAVTTTVKDPRHVYARSGSYTVQLTATSAYGCTSDTSKVLSAFYDKPVAGFVVEPDTLCQGADNVFSDKSTAPNSSIKKWEWEFGDGTGATSRNPVKRYDAPGNYDVKLTVTNAFGCVSNAFTDNVLVYLQPVIDAGPSFVVPQGTMLQFNPTVNDSAALTFRWTPAGDFPDPTVLRPYLQAMHDETYTLTAVGQGNCAAADELTVKVLKPVKVPNAFSPNGDGINDTWVITNLADYPGATVDVYNRYGQRIYTSGGYHVEWDGTWNGRALPLATYYYVIKLQNGFPPLTGNVTILR